MPYSEMTRFAAGHGGSARWGRVVGVCAKCKKPIRSRATTEDANRNIIHMKDGGLIQ